LRVQQARKRARINFGEPIPFQRIPALIEQGFEQLEKQFRTGDQRILEHYQVAHHCLEECLGDSRCDLMLVMVLTLASSSVTPTVAPKTRSFDAGPRKEPALFVCNLLTRMLWFLRPQSFPWEADKASGREQNSQQPLCCWK
jgi:hypothetical protein